MSIANNESEVKQYVCGATVNVRFHGDKKIMPRYFSFGKYDEENETDTFGIDDQSIFFNCEGGEEELKAMKLNNGKSLGEFDAFAYKLEYSEKPEYQLQ